MLFRVDPGSAVPLADQIAASVRGAIADGTVRPGERLPAARALGESLGVNVHTVLRGYQRLREEGLIDLRRGRGAVVTGDQPRARAGLLEGVQGLVDQARALGLSDEEVLTLVRTRLAGG
ncbi:GntR family transcriptional regulator [Streptomyces sp. DSM 41524]|uniref:GntR family transcriptional regulator n=2 Tax=Streptomyces violaceusniger group TaxID=2839105 RepID=A0A6G4AIT0_9ACTN|nr:MULTISPECIES: GntR family transcriptional regulator [Streptomyces]MEE4597032.1 GntR family transcriptional regulator [Streptomyces sp. DSM 41524]NEW73152.1 GntR family transcriptional regulator [Streptomyces rhizosphaericus]TMU90554.1 GntR family transcriptional regulator [Streptomyces sp. DASNCL29]